MTPVPTRRMARGSNRVEDTIAGCRNRAEADLLAAVTVATANERIRFETSAASWSARADMLQRLDDNHEARKDKQRRDGTNDMRFAIRPEG